MFIFSTTLASEIRKGTIRVTLSKPVSRPQYLLGKFLGGVVVMFVYTVTASLAMVLFAESQTVELSPAIRYAPWLMFCRQLMLGSVAMLLSLFMHPLVASVVGFFASDSMLRPPNPLYFILPSYGRFNVVFQVMMGSLIEVGEVDQMLSWPCYGLNSILWGTLIWLGWYGLRYRSHRHQTSMFESDCLRSTGS